MGEFSGLTVPVSIRMPAEMRDELEAAAEKSGKSVTQELLRRLQNSFHRDRDRARDRSQRAFCFLFSELTQVICVSPELAPDWRFDPWLFQTFKVAVAKLLDRFQPTGKMKLPDFWQFVREAPDIEGLPSNKEERKRITESPEAMAEHAVQKVLSDFNSPQRVGRLYKGGKGLEEKMADPADRRIMGHLAQEWGATYYGMIDAQRDLGAKLKSRGGK